MPVDKESIMLVYHLSHHLPCYHLASQTSECSVAIQKEAIFKVTPHVRFYALSFRHLYCLSILLLGRNTGSTLTGSSGGKSSGVLLMSLTGATNDSSSSAIGRALPTGSPLTEATNNSSSCAIGKTSSKLGLETSFLEIVCRYSMPLTCKKSTQKSTCCTVEGIALGPSGNVQGGWYFQNLERGDQLHARSWTELSVPDHVIQRVNDIAREEGAPIIKKGNSENFATVVDDNLFSNPSLHDVLPIAHEDELFVASVSGEPVGNVLPIADEDESFVAPVSDINSTPGGVPPDDPVGVEPVTGDDVPPDEVPSALGLEGAIGEPVAENTDHPTHDVPPTTEGEESITSSIGGETGDSDAQVHEPKNSDVEVCDSETENASVTDAISDKMCNNGGDTALPEEGEQVARQHGYNLRPPKARDYTHLGHTQFYRKLITNLLSLTQMSFKKASENMAWKHAKPC